LTTAKKRSDAHSGTEEIRIGISSCLLGARVRYNGEHKRDAFLTDTLGKLVRFVPVCPEVEIGLGTPRETIRLERRGREVRLDHTDTMRTYARRKVRDIEKHDLCGYILKKNSPSCGYERVKIYDKNGSPSASGRGVFAEELVGAHPSLPVEEEGRLHDPGLRENFFERVFAYRRLKSAFRGRWTVGGLVRFHTAEKLLLLAHHPDSYRSLGRLVARAKAMPRQEVAERYPRDFMDALVHKATRGRHANVLQHCAGYFREHLSGDERTELQRLITDFRKGLIPLVVPVTLIGHFTRKYDVAYLSGQTYLDPHPKELMLRNHV
jgi:uncharacterized protein YbgA (DUF1722 family)/uncharacterized protein YbbK (DUF523 family)